MSKLDDFKYKTVYISGPMTGFENYNKDAFYAKEVALRARGFTSIINPAHIGEIYGYNESHNFYMRKSFRQLMDADAMYVFGDYKYSKGVNMEIKLALSVGIPVFYEEYNDWQWPSSF